METITAHPDALFYLRAQGLITLAIGAALGLFLSVASTKRKIRKGDIPWMVMALVASVFLLFEAVWSFTRSADALTVDGDKLRLGDTTVVIGSDTHVALTGREPARPDADESGFSRLPGGARVPPFFTGGPMIEITSGTTKLSIKPVMYGPSGYFLGNANRTADKLFARLAEHADPDSKGWLTWLSTPAAYDTNAPQSTKSMTFFLAIYVPLSLLVIGFLIGVNVLLFRDRKKKKEPST